MLFLQSKKLKGGSPHIKGGYPPFLFGQRIMDLLDFIEMAAPKTEQEIASHFEILKQMFKKRGNNYGMSVTGIPSEIKPYLLDFEEQKWIQYYSERRYITIPTEFRDWHTPDEAVESIIEQAEEAYLNSNYQMALGVRWHPSFEFASTELRNKYWELSRKAFDGFARRLVQEKKALDYFMKNVEARGSQINRFSEKLEKEVIKVASEEISLILDYDEMKKYFDSHAFFCGLPTYNYQPDIKVIFAGRLVLAALCEATELKDIRLILSYTGGSWTKLNDKRYTIVYPPGWDFFRVFEETSTPEAVAVIESEIARLNRLHNRAV